MVVGGRDRNFDGRAKTVNLGWRDRENNKLHASPVGIVAFDDSGNSALNAVLLLTGEDFALLEMHDVSLLSRSAAVVPDTRLDEK